MDFHPIRLPQIFIAALIGLVFNIYSLVSFLSLTLTSTSTLPGKKSTFTSVLKDTLFLFEYKILKFAITFLSLSVIP